MRAGAQAILGCYVLVVLGIAGILRFMAIGARGELAAMLEAAVVPMGIGLLLVSSALVARESRRKHPDRTPNSLRMFCGVLAAGNGLALGIMVSKGLRSGYTWEWGVFTGVGLLMGIPSFAFLRIVELLARPKRG